MARQRRMRAKSAGGTTSCNHPAAVAFFSKGEGFLGWCGASCNTSGQWRSRLLAPAWGGVRLCGNDWWGRLIFCGWCRFAQDDTWGAGARYVICLVQMLALSARPHPSLRATFPLEGEGFCGGAGLYVIPLSNGDPACWRPAWGGVRCAAMIGGYA